jgi:Ca-activated chloride channel family protein
VTLLAPAALLLVVPVLALAVAYLVVQRRRPRYALRFSSLELLASVAPRRPGWRRHVPAALVLAGLSALVLALARPSVPVEVPRERATVVLAVDVSLSMAAQDVEPSRIESAQEAAREFARELPERFRLGLVAYAGSAAVLVPPVHDREQVVAALDRLTLAESTATGEAVFAALEAVAAVPGEPGQEPPPARIVVLSDGETTVGRPDEVAAQAAVEAGVPVSTIAFGTDAGTVTVEGQLVPVPVNRPALAQLATATGGEAYEARDAGDLARAYEAIGSSVDTETEQREVSGVVTGGALALLLVAGALSLLWGSRLP